MFDKDGVISSERNDLSALQKKYSKGKPGITLGDALKVLMCFRFISWKYFNTDMLLGMANDPIVLRWQIQIEIEYNLAISTKDLIMATGRSDYQSSE
jgi:malate dehydrogenase (oxaloacetate-decarboxylating)(NADP+)